MGDPLVQHIMTMHNTLIGCTLYTLCFKFCLLSSFIYWLSGLTFLNGIFSALWMLVIPLSSFLYFLDFLAVYIILILLVLLFWVFVFWMLIIIFVPFIIIIPIPIIPFFFVLPLKPLMLLLIPPFKTLTDLGTLQLVLRIFKRIFSGEFFTNFLNYFAYPSINDISDYLYENFKQIAKDYANTEDISKYYSQSGNEHKNEEIDTNNPEDVKKYDEYNNKPNVRSGIKLIKYETDMCVKMQQKFKPYNSSYMNDVSTDMENSFSPYNECYAKAIKSYLKTSIG